MINSPLLRSAFYSPSWRLYWQPSALLASLVAMMAFNFFPAAFHTFTIADPQNWVS
jgi:hypothetical protein